MRKFAMACFVLALSACTSDASSNAVKGVLCGARESACKQRCSPMSAKDSFACRQSCEDSGKDKCG